MSKLNIFNIYIKRVFRSRTNLLFMIIVPVVLISFIMLMVSGSSTMPVGFVDRDNTEFTAMLKDNLKTMGRVVETEEAEIRKGLLNNTFEYAIVIDEGFTSSLINNQNPEIRSYRLKEADTSYSVRININSFISAAYNIASAAEGNEEMFYGGVKSYLEGTYGIKAMHVEGTNPYIPLIMAGLGFLVMSMMFLSSFSTNTLLVDKEKKTFFRVLSAPITQKRYMLEAILCFLTVMIIQVIMILLIMRFVYRFDIGPLSYLLRLFAVFCLFSVVCIAFGIAMVNIAKSTKQASVMATLIITPICMIGGCYWPREFMPEILQTVSNLVPTTWVLEAARKVLMGNTLIETGGELAIMVLFASVFFLMGTWRKPDVAK